MNRLLALCFAVLFALPAPARRFDYTPRARLAYESVLNLRFDEAKATLNQLRKLEPDNLIIYHIENYIDCFIVSVLEDPEVYNRLKKNRDVRLRQVESGDPASPYYLFVQADIRLQWALARLKYGEYLSAFTEVNRAYKLLRKNQELFPDFMPNYKDLGILHAMVGTIPDSYMWGVKLLSSLDGTIDQGRRELEMVLKYARNNDFIFAQETRVLYAFFLLHLENDEEGAWQAVNRSGLEPRFNPLHAFIMANIAMRTGRNDTAIRLLEQRPRGPGYFPFHYLDFMLGNAKLRRLDPDAHVPLRRYVQHFGGKNFIKEAYQKLAWHQLLQGNPEGYHSYMKACRQLGDAVAGSDASALQEAESSRLPDVLLLKARLLFDGGYYRQAYEQLSGKSAADFSDPEHQLEFLYRMGRILHGLKQYPQALRYYHLTVERGGSSPRYFACNAALQAGVIYETLEHNRPAAESYQLCLSLNPAEHSTALHQKAKSGLVRLRKESP